jgi:hypothetical protein
MEAGLGTGLAILLCLAAPAAEAQEGPARWIEDFENRFPATSKNAAAEDLETLGLALGFDARGVGAEDHPKKEDRDALLNTGHTTWLEAQLSTSDDSITAPPSRFMDFLESRQSTLWRVVGLLEKEIPEWGFDVQSEKSQFPEIVFVAQLSRFLVAVALVEEWGGRHSQASDLLEASWSLYESVAWRPEMVFQLLGYPMARPLVGALRKMSEAPLQWIGRMEGREPLDRALESLRNDALLSLVKGGLLTSASSDSLWVRLPRVAADLLTKRSACEVSKLSADEIWRPAIEEVSQSIRDEDATELEVVGEISRGNVASALHRAARQVIDSELTGRILELRLERAASRPGRWPEKLFDVDSRVCPGALYQYGSMAGGMSIRFKGVVGEPEGSGKSLPLSFEARAPKPTPTATPTRRASPTPTPAVP